VTSLSYGRRWRLRKRSAVPAEHVEAFAELAYYAAQRGEWDGPVSLAISEGRELEYARGRGSSCVELIDACAYAAGCRDDVINRIEHHGRGPQTGLRWFGPKPGGRREDCALHSGARLWRPSLAQLEAPAILCFDYLSQLAHVAVFLGLLPDGRALTADYGQPGGRLHMCRVDSALPYRPLKLRGRFVDAAINVSSLTFVARPLTVGEWCASRGLPVEPWTPAEYILDR